MKVINPKILNISFEKLCNFLIITFLLNTIQIECLKHSLNNNDNKYVIKNKVLDSESLNRLSEYKFNKSLLNSNFNQNNFKSTLLYGKAVNLTTSEFEFDSTYDSLIFQFQSDSSFWLLTQNINKSLNQIYYGMNSLNVSFYTEFSSFINPSMSEIQINDLFQNPINRNYLIFVDSTNKILFISKDNGKHLRSFNIEFQPESFYFTSNPNIILAYDSKNREIWLTLNSAKKWHRIGENLVQFPHWNLIEKDFMNYIYFVEESSDDNTNHLINFNLKDFQHDLVNENVEEHKIVVTEDVLDFQINNKFFFLSKKSKEKNLELFLSKNGDDYKLANFEFFKNDTKILHFYAWKVTTAEIFVIVSYELDDVIVHDLFKSNLESYLVFELSLPNIQINCDIDRESNQNKCIEIRGLNELGDVYIANAKNQKGFVETFIKRSKDSKWIPIEFENTNKEFSLDLDESFLQSNDDSESLIPGVMIATASDKKLKSKDSNIGVYITQGEEEGNDWYKILDGKYFYSITPKSDNGYVLLAVEKNKPTNKIYYSMNLGDEWNEYFFSDHLVVVNELIKDDRDYLSSFYLISSRANNIKSIIKLEFLTQTFFAESDNIKKTVDCSRTCISKLSKQYICVDQSIKCNTIIDCIDEIDEKNCESEFAKSESNQNLMDFHIENPLNINENSFEISFSLNLPASYKINSYFGRIVSFEDNHSYLPFENNNFKIFNLDNEPFKTHSLYEALNTNDLIKSQQIIESKFNKITVSKLKERTEYSCYFYANITNILTNNNQIIMLNKRMIVLTSEVSYKIANIRKIVATLIPLFILICFSLYLIWICLIKRINFSSYKGYFQKLNETINRYSPVQQVQNECVKEVKRPIVKKDIRQSLIETENEQVFNVNESQYLI